MTIEADKKTETPEPQESLLMIATQELMDYVHKIATRGSADGRMGKPEWEKLVQLDDAFGEYLPMRNRGALPVLDMEFPDRLTHSRLAFRHNPGFKGQFPAASIAPFWWLLDAKRWMIQMRNFTEEMRAIEAKGKA